MKGILFKPAMIKAIVDGRKTQTRRVMQNQPTLMDKVYGKDFRKDFGARKPRYQVGETVYIKEAWRISEWDNEGGQFRLEYRLGGFSEWLCVTNEVIEKYWLPNIVWPEETWHSPMMQRADFARYFIQIADVRAERLQEITEEDAEAEGIDPGQCTDENYLDFPAVKMFARLWDSINKPPYDWDSNPWCFVYSFRMVRDDTK